RELSKTTNGKCQCDCHAWEPDGDESALGTLTRAQCVRLSRSSAGEAAGKLLHPHALHAADHGDQTCQQYDSGKYGDAAEVVRFEQFSEFIPGLGANGRNLAEVILVGVNCCACPVAGGWNSRRH